MLASIVFAAVMSSAMQLPEPVGHGRAEVEAVLTANLPVLEQCNTYAVVSIATFSVSIDESGVVSNAVHALHVDESPRLGEMVPCLVERLRALRFAPRMAAELYAELQFAPAATVRGLVVLTPSVVPDVQLASSASSTVTAAVAPQMAKLVDCYRTTLHTSPSVAGSVVVRHTVGADGAVVDDAIVMTQQPDEILHMPLKACVRRVLREVTYATSTSTAQAIVPLRFVRPHSPAISAMHDALAAQGLALWKCSQWQREPVSVAFTVDTNGTASDSSATDTVDAACVRTVVESVRWPAPGSGTVRVSAKVPLEGGLSRQEIQRVVAADMGRIKYCYDVELNRDRLLHGTITLRYVIGPDGSVREVHTLRPTKPGAVELTNPKVVDCVLDVIRRHRYPQPKGGGLVNVTYPFVFAPP
jgi:hypothetical protein